jgi:hypothetical protein
VKNVFTGPGCAGAIADGHFPGYREDNETGILFSEGETKDVVLRVAGTVGIKVR